METPQQRVDNLQTEVEAFTRYLGSLSPDAWHQSSVCDQWLVADVVSHLAAMGHGFADRLARGLQGDIAPSEGLPQPSEYEEDTHAESRTQRAIAHRERLGDDVLASFITGNDKLHQGLAALRPQDWDTLCYHPPGPITVREMVDMRLTEVAMHGWDIRASFDPQASLSEDSLPALVKTIPRAVRRAFRPDANRTRTLRYRLNMTEPVAATTDILLNADGASVEADSQVEADVTFRCDTATAVLVIFGRVKLADAIADGRIRVEGDRELAITFGQSFQGG